MESRNGVWESGSRNCVHKDRVDRDQITGSGSLSRVHRFRFRPIIAINLTGVFSALWLASGRARPRLEACEGVRERPAAARQKPDVLREHSGHRLGLPPSWDPESVHGWMGQILGLLSIPKGDSLGQAVDPNCGGANGRLGPDEQRRSTRRGGRSGAPKIRIRLGELTGFPTAA